MNVCFVLIITVCTLLYSTCTESTNTGSINCVTIQANVGEWFLKNSRIFAVLVYPKCATMDINVCSFLTIGAFL